MNRVIIIIVGLLFITLSSKGQRFPGYTLAKPSLNLRATPTSSSDILTTIPYGTKVMYHLGGKPDTLNGEKNEWYKIEYDSISGFVWGKYLSSNKNLILDYGSLLVGQDGSKYNPDLNWYGISETDVEGICQMKKVDISLVELYDEIDGNLPNRVKINIEGKTLFLFGTKKDLSSKEIPGISLRPEYNKDGGQKDFEKQIQNSFLYPEQIMNLKLSGITSQMQIKAKDAPYLDSTDNHLYTRYELELAESFYYYGTTKAQNITSEIPFINAPAFQCAVYKNPRIYWYGDLDQDQKIDLVIKTSLMSDTCGNESSLIIFLSSEAEMGDYLKIVAKSNSDY